VPRLPLFLLVSLAVACAAASRRSATDGLYIFGHEVNTFRPCQGDSVFWVIGARPMLDSLRAGHSRLTSQPYQPIYMRAVVARSDAEADGFAAQYDGLLEVREILELRLPRDGECNWRELPPNSIKK